MSLQRAPHARRIPTLAEGTVQNLLGQVLPAIAALIAIPIVQKRLGDPQLGILVLTWTVVGYLGIFDLGFRRTLAWVVASDRNAETDRAPRLVWTTVWLLAGLGAVGGAALVLAGPWLVPQITSTGFSTTQGAWLALVVMAVSLPCVAIASGLRGVVEGHQQFGLLNLVRTPTAVAGYLGPVITCLFSPSVVPAMVVVAATRIAGAAGLAAIAFRLDPRLRLVRGWTHAAGRDLATTGGWITIANVTGSLMLYLDRFVVGALAPLAAVAYYSTPQEFITKLLIVSAAVTTASFPAMTAHAASGATRELGRVYERTTMATLVMLGLPVLVVSMLAPDWLTFWVGRTFAIESAGVVWWIALGTLIAGISASPLSLLQAAGKSRLTAVIQLALLPVYLALAIALTMAFGINGAAAAWTARLVVECIVLSVAAERVVPGAVRQLPLLLGIALCAVAPLLSGHLDRPGRWLATAGVTAIALVAANRTLKFDLRQALTAWRSRDTGS